MSEHPSEEHGSLIKTPKQLVIVVVLAFVVPITVIVMLTQLITGGGDTSERNPAMSAEAVAKRIKPVGDVVVDPNQPAAAAPAQVAAVPAAAAAPAAAAKADSGKGKSVYDTACTVCHTAGVAGAPKLGDKAAWAPRVKTGLDALYAASLKGKNAMPPKGGNMALADADVKAAVDFMVGSVK